MTDIEARKQQLLARRAELLERLNRIDDELDEAPNPDWEENAIEKEDDEVLEALGESGLSEYRAIEAALRRIEDGSYGICVSCGEEIEEGRLDLVPHTPLCKQCASQRAG